MKILSLIICLIFGLSSTLDASELQDASWAQKIVEETIENMTALESVDDFGKVVAEKKKKRRRRKKRRRKRRRRKKRSQKKDSRMSQKWSKAGRFYLEGNLGSVSHNSLTADEIQEQIGLSPTVSNYTVEGSSIGMSFGGGYYLKDWLAFEGFYSLLGVEESSFDTSTPDSRSIERTFSALELNAKFAYWMGQTKNFALYAKPGLMLWNLSVDTTTTPGTNTSESASGTSFTFGLGGEYYLSQNFYMGAGLMLYPSLGNDELGSQGHTKYFVSAGYLF